MSKWKFLLTFMASILFLAACGGQANTSEGETSNAPAPCENTLVPVKVDFSWEPQEGSSADQYTFKAIVTHDGIAVSDAQEVKFEIWEHSNPDYHFMEETKNEGDGVYTLEWNFPKDGVYYAYYHVTACDMHVMEKQMVVVGDVDVEAITAEPDTVKGQMEHGHNNEGDGEHNHSH